MNLKSIMITVIFLLTAWLGISADQTAIRSDYQKGELSASQYLYYTFLELYAHEELPESYRIPAQTARRSRFGLIGELKNRLDEVEEPYRSRMRSMLSSRPTGLPYTLLSPSGHFMIHYTTTGYHAVDTKDADHNGIPDYVDQVGLIFDHVYRIEIDSLGYRHYKEDAIDGSQLDVYIQNLGGDYGGCAWDETTCITCTPFITIDNDFVESSYSTHGLEAVRVTAAHEFFHALQLNYRWDPSEVCRYWYEISSTWMEDMIEDSVNDYLSYLNIYYTNTNSSLTAFGNNTEYSKVPWAFYMAESYSPDIIRQLWDDYTNPGRQPHHSFDHVLPDGFASNFVRFAYWNTFTGHQAVTDSFFSEGTHYPELTTIDWGMAGNRNVSIQPLAVQYYRYTPERNGGVRLSYDYRCSGFIKGIGYDGTPHPLFFSPTSGSTPLLFPNLSLYRHLIIALVNPTPETISSQFSLEFDSTLYDVALINGQVVDQSGKGIAQATIELNRSPDHQVMIMTQSGSAGGFSLPIPDSLLDQNLNLRVETAGYEIVKWTDFRAEEWLDSLLTIPLYPLSNGRIGAWPNPFQDQLAFGYFEAYRNPEAESYQVQLYTLDGQIIYQDIGEALFNRIEIPSHYLEPLSSGVYLYYLKLGPISRRGRIIKKRSD